MNSLHTSHNWYTLHTRTCAALGDTAALSIATVGLMGCPSATMLARQRTTASCMRTKIHSRPSSSGKPVRSSKSITAAPAYACVAAGDAAGTYQCTMLGSWEALLAQLIREAGALQQVNISSTCRCIWQKVKHCCGKTLKLMPVGKSRCAPAS
jgi:hypothetical protein